MKTLILDIDETLVSSSYIGHFDAYTPIAGEVLIKEQDHLGVEVIEYSSMCRPGVQEFLHKVNEIGWRVICLTQGVVPFQETVLAHLDLRDYVGEIYGWTSVQRTQVKMPPPMTNKYVLVDDLHYSTTNTAGKAYWLNTQFDESVNFVYVESFNRGNLNPKPLMNYLPKIEELLR